MSTPAPVSSGSVLIKVMQDRGAKTDLSVRSGASDSNSSSNNKPFIRRPTRGVQIRDNTFATIRLVAMVNGKNKPLIDAGSRRSLTDEFGNPIEVAGKKVTDIYSNFLLQAVNEERAEKSQILETFGEPYIFLFGERPRMLTFQGILLNTFDFNWQAEWWENYDLYLRGTAAVNADARMYIQYDQNLVGGYIVGCSSANTVNEPYHVSFSFQVFVTSYTNFSGIGNPDASRSFPLSGAGARFFPDKPTEVFMAGSLDAAMRPRLLDGSPSSLASGLALLNNPSTSLFDSFQSEVASVSSAWSSTLGQATTAMAGIAGQFALTPIHVPVGFAGATEFDTDAVKVDFISEQFYQDATGNPLVVKYSVFSDNDDEYVGSSDHYGSSMQNGIDYAFEPTAQELTHDIKMVTNVSKAWVAAGYPIALDTMGNEVRAIVNGELGLLVTGIAPIAVGVAQNAAEYIPRIASETPQPPMHLAEPVAGGDTTRRFPVTITTPVPPPPPVGSATPPLGAQIFKKVSLNSADKPSSISLPFNTV